MPSGHFERADMRQYEPPAGLRFDAVWNNFSLFDLNREEIEEIEEMAVRWSRWLPVDGRCARDIGARFMGADVKITLMTRIGWERLLGENGFEILDTMTELFVPPKESDSEEEAHYYIVARKVQ